LYLVTGGAGFIGSNIVRRLVEDKQQVKVLDNFLTGKIANLSGLEQVEVIEGSLTEWADVKRALEGVEYVIHQGAIPSVPRSLADPISTNEANVTGTLNLLVAAKEASVKRVVLAASSSAYGDTEVLPKEESMPGKPLSPYAVSKHVGELYANVFSLIYELQTVSLRYFNIFGPYQDPASEYAAVIPKFILKMLKGEQPVIYGDGEQSRDFTYIDNAVNANRWACLSEHVGQGEVINIACGERYTLNQLVEYLNQIMGTKIKPLYSEPKLGDVRHSQADTSRAERLLGYRVEVGFRDGLERTVAWFRSTGG